MCALAQTQDPRIPVDERAELHEVRLLSLGTGRSLQHIEGTDATTGATCSGSGRSSTSCSTASTGSPTSSAQQLLGDDHYHRLAPTFPPGKKIDQADVGEIPYLRDFASQLDLTKTADWLRANW